MEIDFHGMTWPEARAAFLDSYRFAVRSGASVTRSIRVIHGYGSTGVGGVLRLRFRDYLQEYRRFLAFKPGEEIDGNRGWTLVQPIAPIPDDDEDLEDLILDYCQQPRTLKDIAGEFHGYGDPKVWQAVETLLKSPPLLANVGNSKLVLYQTI